LTAPGRACPTGRNKRSNSVSAAGMRRRSRRCPPPDAVSLELRMPDDQAVKERAF